MDSATNVYERLGVRPAINARGFNTIVGGNTPSPRMKEAMDQAQRYFVDMQDLLAKSGEIVAKLMGAEAAYITPGAAAALTLGTAACITGDDMAKVALLPDTTGMKNKVVIQKNQTYQYDRSVTIVGPKLIEVGDATGTTAAQLEAALDDKVACVLYPAHLEDAAGCVPLAQVLEIGHRNGVPVLVDAAAQVFPIDRFLSFPKMGADLVAYSCKYFGGPNSTGMLVGKKALVDAAVPQGFIGFETVSNRKGYGRPFKLNREEIIAVVVCVQDWLSMDHDKRLADLERRIAFLSRGLEGLPGVSLEVLKRGGSAPRVLRVALEPGTAKHTAESGAAALRDGNPRVLVNNDARALLVNPGPIHERDMEIVAQRLRALLA
jgi:L-seryl-tRNA(Ser) seleniumtransferase